MSIDWRVSTEHQCLLKHLQPSLKLARLDEDKDWLSAWHCSHLPLLPQLLPLGLWGHPDTSQRATPFFWLHPLWLFPFPSFPFPSFPLLSTTPPITQRWQPTRQSHPSALLVEWAAAGWDCRDPERSKGLLRASVSSLSNTSHPHCLLRARQNLLVKEVTQHPSITLSPLGELCSLQVLIKALLSPPERILLFGKQLSYWVSWPDY